MNDRLNTPTLQVSQWLSNFAAALERADPAAAAEMFADESYWRDLVSFTWNITTVEGQGDRGDARSDAAASEAKQLADRGRGHRGRRGCRGLVHVRNRRGARKGPLRLKDGKCWTLLTTMTELKGFEEQQGRDSRQGC